MGLINKVSKKTTRSLIVVGSVFSGLGIASLVYGCQATLTLNDYIRAGQVSRKRVYGIGSQNYGHLYSDETKNFTENTWRKESPEVIKRINELYDKTKGSYEDFKKEWKKTGEEAKKLDEKTNVYGESLYYQELAQFANTVQNCCIFEKIGIIILPIFAVILILGITLTILNKKNNNSKKNSKSSSDQTSNVKDNGDW